MPLKIGVNLMTRGAGADGDNVLAIARHAEKLGFDYISANDHVVVPRGINSIYPYAKDGAWAGASSGECLDILAVLGFLAAATDRIGLLSSVMVIPHRQAVQTAKTLATIDRLSGGRLIVGCGAGWLKEEFEAIQVPPYEERGRVSDEYIEAFRNLWTEEAPEYKGRFVAYKDIIFAPKPVQTQGPAIWVGGESPAAIRRAARLGDGWYPASINPRFPLTTPAEMSAGIQQLSAACEKAGRDPGKLHIGYFAIAPVSARAAALADGARHPFTGAVADILEDFAAFEALGVESVVVNLQQPELAETLDQISWFAEDILGRLKRS